jgi:ribosomal protein L37AE/L43A
MKSYNALDFHFNKRIINAQIRIECPVCEEQMSIAYIVGPILYCEKCAKTYTLKIIESKTTMKQLKDDGWLKECQ